ncbi:hypothetical protein SBRY_20246 [Actinacidiphila bryophytorum]|uniref:Uncharacterized protein n=1 Tax=Actinacidiphila bryophytorum TaxID=1436133 RepID=A0A9W4E989_9ACTN|nr:hypothetical protein SBRY_20246 [Actinacidiphila bryophytorum]
MDDNDRPLRGVLGVLVVLPLEQFHSLTVGSTLVQDLRPAVSPSPPQGVPVVCVVVGHDRHGRVFGDIPQAPQIDGTLRLVVDREVDHVTVCRERNGYDVRYPGPIGRCQPSDRRSREALTGLSLGEVHTANVPSVRRAIDVCPSVLLQVSLPHQGTRLRYRSAGRASGVRPRRRSCLRPAPARPRRARPRWVSQGHEVIPHGRGQGDASGGGAPAPRWPQPAGDRAFIVVRVGLPSHLPSTRASRAVAAQGVKVVRTVARSTLTP